MWLSLRSVRCFSGGSVVLWVGLLCRWLVCCVAGWSVVSRVGLLCRRSVGGCFVPMCSVLCWQVSALGRRLVCCVVGWSVVSRRCFSVGLLCRRSVRWVAGWSGWSVVSWVGLSCHGLVCCVAG